LRNNANGRLTWNDSARRGFKHRRNRTTANLAIALGALAAGLTIEFDSKPVYLGMIIGRSLSLFRHRRPMVSAGDPGGCQKPRNAGFTNGPRCSAT
jgi:hypothetical protein